MTRISLIILGLLILPFATMADCPLGQKDSHLTIGRLMRNFGRYTADADYICIKSKNPREKISDAEITDATADLGIAIECAEQVLKNPTGDVLPTKLVFMTDEKEKAKLVDDYIYFMTDFKDALIEYRKVISELGTMKPSERNYSEACEKYEDVDNLVNRAHKKL